ncbi:MAG TPA: hypothetical protein VLT34_10950 [Arthrobacter sp.]|nr:hypothetical protein [Arthrobacter sp.]
MGTSRTTGWAIAAALVLSATGCAQASGQVEPSGSPSADSQAQAGALSSAPPATPEASGQAPGGGLTVTTIPLGKNGGGVEAKLPINGYFATPGLEITFDASTSIGPIGKYEWDLDGDGTYDQTTTTPVLKHSYKDEFEGEMMLRVSDPVGNFNVLKTPVHVSNTPAHQRLAPPANVQVEVLSTAAGISEVKVTWESNDPTADSWAVAVNGFPVGRIEKSARSVTVKDIEREEDVLLQVFGMTVDGAVGHRAGTTLPAAK